MDRLAFVGEIHPIGQSNFLQIVHATDGLRFGLGLRQRGQEQCGEDCNDGDNHQQFDQREGRAARDR